MSIDKLHNNIKNIKLHSNVLQILFLGSFIIILYHVSVGSLLFVPAADVAKCILMQIFGLLFPGTALYVLLYKNRRGLFGAFFLSYSFGYAFNIVSYFLFVPFGMHDVIPYFVVLAAVASGWIIIKNGSGIEFDGKIKDDIPFVVIFAIFLVLNVFAYSGANASPYVTESAVYRTDTMFWIENTSALARQFPPLEPRVYNGSVLYHHYFSNVQLAFVSLASGVDIFTLSVPFFALGKSIIFFGSFYVLFAGCLKNKYLRLLGIVVICFCDGLDRQLMVTYTAHIWTDPFGFDIGFSFGALFLHCFYMQYQKSDFDIRTFVLSLFVFGICVGLKVPVALIVMAASGIICIAWLLKKRYKKAFWYGICLLTVFFIIAVFCTGLWGGREGRTGSFSATGFISESAFLSDIYTAFSPSLPALLKGILIVIVYCFCVNPVTFGLFALAGTSLLTKRSMRTSQNIGLFFSGLFGLFLGIFNVQSGNSEMYFTMSSFIPCLLFGLIWLGGQSWDMFQKKQAALLCGGMVCIQICFMMFQSSTLKGYGLLSSMRAGYTNLFDKENACQEFSAEGLQRTDLDALVWIRENTAESSILLVDRGIIGGMPGYMLYGAFSERQMYIEGDIYFRERFVEERDHMRTVTEQVFMNSEDAVRTAAEEGVDFILQTKWLTPDFSPGTSLVKLVYEGESINVYEVNS